MSQEQQSKMKAAASAIDQIKEKFGGLRFYCAYFRTAKNNTDRS